MLSECKSFLIHQTFLSHLEFGDFNSLSHCLGNDSIGPHHWAEANDDVVLRLHLSEVILVTSNSTQTNAIHLITFLSRLARSLN